MVMHSIARDWNFVPNYDFDREQRNGEGMVEKNKIRRIELAESPAGLEMWAPPTWEYGSSWTIWEARELQTDRTCAIEPIIDPRMASARAKPTDAGIAALG